MAFDKLTLGCLLGSFFTILCDKLVALGVSFFQREGIDAENWKKLLQDIYWHLEDAEDRQLFGDRAVKSWLEDAKDVAYDMEDLLDEFAIEAAKQKQGAESSTSGGLRKRKRPSFPSLVFDVNMRSKVKDIESRLQDILTRRDRLRLKESVGSRSTSVQVAKRLPSSSLKEPFFVGRKKEENEIIHLLTTDIGYAIPTIIPIVGMGGIGKTALTQRVYNDHQVAHHFEVKAWICVSDVFDVPGITRAILQSISEGKAINCEGKDLNWLQVKTEESLSGKKFLIVLDDVWNENNEEWIVLLKPFISGAKGSKVIVTSRNHEVASIARAPACPSMELQQDYRIELEGLQQDYCTELLAYQALGVKNFKRHPHLEEIGKKIVEKCKGLPLAAKTLGGLLRTAVGPKEWKAILNSKFWDLPQGPNDILPALRLSYIHLPFHLKRCFAYCAIFPKDFEIERDKLIYWWMAEGLLGDNNIENRWDNGLKNFKELVSRSFFQQGKESQYLMHDLIHDLARSVGGATCFSAQELESEAYENNVSLARARHASFVSKDYVTLKMLRRYHGMKKLRSFVTLHVGEYKASIAQKALHDLVPELKYARVFSMTQYHITEVPDSICELKYLRHLDFSYTDIQTLPKSIGSINNLEVLLLRGCSSLTELPQEIENLYKLQYLDIRDTPRLRAMPSNLANLKILPQFIVGTQKRTRLKELKHLIHLDGELFISELQQVEQVQDAKYVNLHEKQGIDKLVLEWAEDVNDSRNKEHENMVLDFLQPCINLKILKISHYGGTRFPPWLGNALYASIVRVDVHGCHNVTLLPMFGQLPSLKELHFHGLNSVREVGDEFYGYEKPFPSLRTLEFNKMSIWQDWSHCDGVHKVEAPFSCLTHLIIRDCPQLVGRLPRRFDSLTKLEIYSCPCLEESPHVISLPFLQELYLRNCNVGILNSLVDLTSLTTLEIGSILELIYFERGFTKSLAKLERLKIEHCEKLNYLWRDGDEVQYLASLRSLDITWCPRLTSLMAMPPHLQELCLIGCDSLPPLEFESVRFPVCLKSLEIQQCQGMESITERFGMEHQWIENISIWGCYNLRSLEFGEFFHLKKLSIMDFDAMEVRCFPPLPITISHLELRRCANIKYLPSNLDQLTSMETLEINKCENIRCFPEAGLPPNLCYFSIRECENMKTPIREWCLHLLTSLDSLWIDGSVGGMSEKLCLFTPADDDDDDEDDAWGFLPSSLTKLYIRNMRKWERLSSGLRNHLPSLQTLCIIDCPKLRYLPKDGVPPSLGVLDIRNCGRLEEGFSKPNGHYCHLLREIPCVYIDDYDQYYGGIPYPEKENYGGFAEARCYWPKEKPHFDQTNLVSSEEKKPEAMLNPSKEIVPVQKENTEGPEDEDFTDTDPLTALRLHSSSSRLASEIDSHHSESDSEARPRYKKMRREDFKRVILERAPLLMQQFGEAEPGRLSMEEIDVSVCGEEQNERLLQRYGIVNCDAMVDFLIERIGSTGIRKIGLLGKHEDSKTIMAEALKQAAVSRGLFDTVICVSAPPNRDGKKVKMDIAGQMPSSLTKAKGIDISDLLTDAFRGIKVLLILFPINQSIMQETTRIPEQTWENGSQIVFVTGSEQLCREMKVDCTISLDDPFSWEVFCQNVGEVVYSTEVQAIAREIVKMCSHNSHAIILVARALRNVSDIWIWICTLGELNPQLAIDEDIEALMFDVLRLSLEHLEDDKSRKCLKNLALGSKNLEITTESVIGQWIRDSMVDTYEEGKQVLKRLIDANLLEDCGSGESVKFQDLDLHVLVNLVFQAEDSQYFLMQGGLGLIEPPNLEEWQNAKEIWLMDNEISYLPEEPMFYSLSKLFLQRNYELRTIPSSFFNYMPMLEVLNLSRTHIQSLPESISQLANLKRFFLNDCVLLRSIPPAIGKLKQLELFDFEGTRVVNLPKEIENLVNLTCLGVSISRATTYGQSSKGLDTMIPLGVISTLSRLEELNLDVDPDAEWWEKCVQGIVGEVCSLKQLSCIKFYFPRLELLGQFNQLRKLNEHPSFTQFQFLVGSHANSIMNRLPSDVEFELEWWDRYLRYRNGIGVPGEIKETLQCADAFFLERHATVKKLSEFGIKSMEQLKCCVLGECNELEALIDEADNTGEEGKSKSTHYECICLGLLEYLYVFSMRNLRCIWKGSVQKGFLSSLKSLTLHGCPKLIVIFTLEMLDNLDNLEEIKIDDCPAVTSLISLDGSRNTQLKACILLPMLNRLSLHYVPELCSISWGVRIAPSLEWLSFYYCPKLISAEEVAGEHLKRVKGESSWKKGLKWSGRDRFQGIFVDIKTGEAS